MSDMLQKSESTELHNYWLKEFKVHGEQIKEAAIQVGIVAQSLVVELGTPFAQLSQQLKPVRDLMEKREAEIRRIKVVKARQSITRKTRRRIQKSRNY